MDGDGKEFMEKTRHHNLGQPDQGQKLVPPPLQLEVPVGAELVELPAAEQIVVPVMDLRKAIESRATVRKYHDEPLSMDELAYLLWCTQGVKKIIPDRVTFRNVPSAGARHPFETYILINNITGLKPGLYRYLALEHKLMIVSLEAALAEQIAQSAFNQPHIKQSAATFIWSAVIWRMKSRYVHGVIAIFILMPAIFARISIWLLNLLAAEFALLVPLMMIQSMLFYVSMAKNSLWFIWQLLGKKNMRERKVEEELRKQQLP